FNSGTFNLGAGTAGGSGTVAVTGATLELGANSVTVTHLSHTSGIMDGTGTLTVTAGADLSGADPVEIGSGTTVLQGSSQVGSNSASLDLDGGRILENHGTLAVVGLFGIHLDFSPFSLAGGGTIN